MATTQLTNAETHESSDDSVNLNLKVENDMGHTAVTGKTAKNKFQKLPSISPPPTTSSNKTCYWAKLSKEQKAIYILVFIIILLALALILVIVGMSNANNSNNQSLSSVCHYDPSSFSPSSNRNTTTSSTFDSRINNVEISKPKNIIVMIGDGMGTIVNTAYRLYKNVDRTILDEHFKGRYSTNSANHTITDSGAGAIAFASGLKSFNGHIGTDAGGNPTGTILEAAKRQNKGTGLIALKSITDATPASFAAHTLQRYWHTLISKQMATLHTNYKWNNCTPVIDIALGGGKKWFDSWGFNESLYQEYGWNKLVYDNSSLYALCPEDLPLMGLFAETDFPFHIDIINGNDTYPTLLDMSKMAIHLLNESYYENGFFLMIEGSKIDIGGHSNDIGAILTEMDSFTDTVDYVINWAKNDNDTLVVILSDHQTGGLTIGREDSFLTNSLEKRRGGPPNSVKDDEYIEYYGNFIDNPLISSSQNISKYTTSHLYKWHPEIVSDIKHSAKWLSGVIDSNNNYTASQLFELVEQHWFDLSDQEKSFLNFTLMSGGKMEYALVYILNVRTNTGFTSHGHTAVDVSLYAYGVSADSFIGHWSNDEIGQLLSRIMDCVEEQNEQTLLLEELWLNGTLQLCDKTDKLKFIEWNDSVPYPYGNKLYPQNCVDAWEL